MCTVSVGWQNRRYGQSLVARGRVTCHWNCCRS